MIKTVRIGRMPRWLGVSAGLCSLAMTAACSSASATAVRTGPYNLGPHAGPVAIYSLGEAPPGATDLGVVEAHAAQSEATVEVLMPMFVERAANIGANAVVIEGIRARFNVVSYPHYEIFYYPCGYGAMCSGQRYYGTNDEVMVVTMYGRALKVGGQP